MRSPIKFIEKKVEEASGGKVKIIGNYNGMLHKCLFSDKEYGEFEAYPVNVIHHKTRHPDGATERREDAMLKHFGVRHHMQIASQSLKVAIKHNRKFIEKHWETGEKIICIASYELKTVQWLNKTKIRFLWQPHVFFMPDGKRSYRPDAYLIDSDLWIEIKGRFYPAAKEKWDWFHSEYKNSELWNKDKLQEIGILPKRKMSI
ncbi:hypothetical protein M0R72_00285 [Candidatus Pacearchaeota archaeon]|jgi:hypothetical protein|uniref:hypothetical protein n=1 Tax=Methanoregula sp. TaxID=2052170 RepID=UPI0035623FA2|nr:hypothetical protein [Candidatus Pacearchaeota archaeon]